MNAAKAKKSPAKVKGAVLIMILAVMTVMIILLAGSIAVVYSAHNRASVKYSESQGYYTARSVLDNFFAELSESTDQKDSTNASIGTYYQLDLKNNTVVSKPLCIGRSIELELYKPKLEVREGTGYADWFVEYCDSNASSLNAQLKGFDPSIPASSDLSGNALYQAAEKYYVNLEKSALSDYSTFSSFYNQYASVTTADPSMESDTIIYEIESLDGFGSGTIDTDGDGSPDTSMQFGKLSDTGASKAWITVQVTERIFAMGEGTTYAERFKNGKRSEDHIVAKVTAHVIYDGEEMTTTQIWVSSPPPIVDADTGLSSLGPINDAASITGVGDVATLTQTLSKFSNDPTFSGNVFFDGSLEHNNTDATATLEDGEVFFVGGTYKTSVNNFKGVNPGSVFYANRFQLWSTNSFTNGNVPVNIIANKFEIHSSQKRVDGRFFAETFDTMSSSSTITYPDTPNKNSIKSGNMLFETNNTQIYGDVYCNYLGIPADRVYAVVDQSTSTITLKINTKGDGTAIVSGDSNRVENMMAAGNKIYVYKGIRIINGVENQPIAKDQYGNDVPGLVNRYETYNDVSGNARTDFTVGKQFTLPETDTFLNFGGDSLVTGLTIKIDWGDATNVIVDKTSSGAKLNLDYYAAKSDNVWTLNDRYYKEFTLPSGVTLLGSSETKFSLPTHRSIYGNYFFKEISSGTTAALYPKTFDEDTGAFTMSTADGDFPTFLQEHAITAEAILAGVDVNSPVDIVNIPEMSFMTNPVTIGSGGGDTVNGIDMPASSNVISSSGYIAPPSGNAFNSFKSTIHYIDARSSDLDIQLGDGVNPVEMAGAFIVYGDNHVTVTIPGVNGGGNAQTVKLGSNGAKFIFATEEIFSGLSKDNFVIGEGISSINSGATTSSPNIDWYFSKNIAQADVATGGGINGAPSKSNETTLCGYINAPTVFFNIDTNANGIERATYYFKDRIQPSSNEKYTICGSIFCRQYTGGQHAGVCFIPRDSGYVDDGSKPLLNKNGMYRSRR